MASPILSIWFKRLTPGDFFNIERSPAVVSGGGGMTYIDLPARARDALFQFLERVKPTGNEEWPRLKVDAAAIAAPGETETIRFDHRGSAQADRYKISNQARQTAGSERHTAWSEQLGFPKAPNDVASVEEARTYLGEGVTIYLVKTTDGSYFAGFFKGEAVPLDWPHDVALGLLREFGTGYMQIQPSVAAEVGGNAPPTGTAAPGRREVTAQQVERDTAVAEYVKTLHDYRCQVCDVQLLTPGGPYAQGAHIRPLGRPHDGPDTPDNVLCLCPNHHVLFDLGAMLVEDDLAFTDPLSGERRTLRTHPNHVVEREHLAYHRGLFQNDG